ncbi:NAD(P)/FAD-dependent oxidoreductase [Ottowia sp. GY511]|uniref:NAD(P)/FAD-dependent oxidoreductase n=2 Tax=Ottowia TaxID=219181 RepID=A0ABW4KML8_9BURK|nr:NAD(P)/FAD-dependent oxidoreductase [Ottowia sp. GY511]TXK29637.1 NAD(P)/FAD-dependent oxidoreductase [Ottowia sp. GY511]
MNVESPSATAPLADLPQACDVLVIGGGPAGSTVGTLLARMGHDVVVLDKDAHPRFHIGESLLPANLPLFEKLGVADEMRQIGIEKWAAEFMSPWHDHKQAFQFGEAWDKSMPYAYQVRRSDFDRVLLENTARAGARVLQQCRVEQVNLDAADHVEAQARMEDGRRFTCRARFLVDASGRDTFLASRLKIKHKNPKHNSVAVFTHFAGAQRNEGMEEGNISIYWFDHGWFWFIPLRDGATSVGMVTWPYYMRTRGDRDLGEFLRDGIATCAPLAARLQDASIVHPPEATGNFSYLSERTHGRNYVMLGDAYAFIDPVFSSGVMLAMQGGFDASEAIHTWLTQPQRQAQALARLDSRLRHGPREFSWFIYRMTNPAMRDLFMGPRNILRMKEALLSLLAGDIWGKTPIWHSLRAFKVLYYMSSLRHLPRSVRAWQRRKINIRAVDDAMPLSKG